jgi:hypothetical protein
VSKTLDELVEALPPDPTEMVEIDVSEYLGEEPKTTLFEFRDPGANQQFQANKDAKKLTTMPEFFGMVEELMTISSMMALAHVSPPFTNPPGITYARMAKNNSKLFMWLMNRFFEKFPHLKDMEAAIKAAKKQSSVE